MRLLNCWVQCWQCSALAHRQAAVHHQGHTVLRRCRLFRMRTAACTVRQDSASTAAALLIAPTFFAFAKGAGVMGEAGPEAILPLRRGADGKLGVVAAGSGGDGRCLRLSTTLKSTTTPATDRLVRRHYRPYITLGKKAAIDFWQQQSRDGGYCWRRAITMETFNWKIRPDMTVESEPKVTSIKLGGRV
ncbi:tail protein [Salmonella enterica subsp. enterica]|uniref:Tail protein n=1 Tax=Salmonella enterica I TaxID=59201 RepID=A0A447N6B7_SALET|nr:tail protein [Salmonella enterica subsp. enterica]